MNLIVSAQVLIDTAVLIIAVVLARSWLLTCREISLPQLTLVGIEQRGACVNGLMQLPEGELLAVEVTGS
jgi:hypothetical protein